MDARIPVGNWHHTAIVVRDYRRVIANFARFFGIARWEVLRVDQTCLSNGQLQGEPAQPGWISVSGHNGEIGIQLVQPTEGASSYRAMLDRVGEGMYGIAASICDADGFADLRQRLADEGVGVLQSGTLFDAVDIHHLDTRETLANVILEVHVPRRSDWQSALQPDEVLTFDLGQLGPTLLPLSKMLHIGVVCRDRDRTKRHLQQLLGMQRWLGLEIETGVTMEDTSYYGEPCHHAYDNHVGRLGELCFELITPRTDKCVYADFLRERGEGMHHIFATICTKQVFAQCLPELERNRMPIIQGGRIGDLMEYYYVDTRDYLPGITTEVVIPLRPDWLQQFFPDPAQASILTGD